MISWVHTIYNVIDHSRFSSSDGPDKIVNIITMGINPTRRVYISHIYSTYTLYTLAATEGTKMCSATSWKGFQLVKIVVPCAQTLNKGGRPYRPIIKRQALCTAYFERPACSAGHRAKRETRSVQILVMPVNNLVVVGVDASLLPHGQGEEFSLCLSVKSSIIVLFPEK